MKLQYNTILQIAAIPLKLKSQLILAPFSERLSELTGWKEGSVKLQRVVGSFFTQVVPDNSVDLGVSVNAVHWLSHRLVCTLNCIKCYRVRHKFVNSL